MTTSSWTTEAATLSSMLAEQGLAVVAGRWAAGTCTVQLEVASKKSIKKEALGEGGT